MFKLDMFKKESEVVSFSPENERISPGINGCKITCPFEMVPFQGGRVNFFFGWYCYDCLETSNQSALIKKDGRWKIDGRLVSKGAIFY